MVAKRKQHLNSPTYAFFADTRLHMHGVHNVQLDQSPNSLERIHKQFSVK